MEGEAVKRVATLYGIHRKTCKRMLELANEPAPSGGVHGFAVCLPQVRLVDPKPRDKEAPVLKHAYGMTRLVDSLPELKAALINRSEGRRVGKECVSTCRSRWSPYH